MDIESLRTFVWLCDTGSFSLTAGKLYISQSTVSKRIQELEKETGKRLVQRKKVGISLTNEGRIFERYARGILQSHQNLLEELKMGDAFSQALNIGVTCSFFQMHLKDALLAFGERYPDVALHIVFGHSGDILKKILSGEIDAAFVHHTLNYPGFDNLSLEADELGLFSSCEDAEYESGISVSELLKQKYLDTNFLYLPEIQMLSAYDGFPALKVDIAVFSLSFLEKGSYYAILPKLLIQQMKSEGNTRQDRIREIPIVDFALPPVQNYAVMKKNNQSKPLQALLDWFRVAHIQQKQIL